MDKLRSMETFIAVVESGSFTGAAARLEMSAVMVGKYVALLEAQLGTRLLERNTRRQSLTDAGVHRIQRRGAVRVHPRQQILKHVRVAQLLPLRFAQQIDIIALASSKLGQCQFFFFGGLRFNHRDPVSRI